MVRVVIPTFNEAENVPRLMADLVPRAAACGEGRGDPSSYRLIARRV